MAAGMSLSLSPLRGEARPPAGGTDTRTHRSRARRTPAKAATVHTSGARSVLGRSQYTLYSSHGRACVGMKSERPPVYPDVEPCSHAHAEPSPVYKCDPVAKMSCSPPAPHGGAAPSSPLRPVLVEGLGRVIVHDRLLGAPGTPAAPRRRCSDPRTTFRPCLRGGPSGTPHSQLPELAWPDAPESPWSGTCDAIRAQHARRQRGIIAWLSDQSEEESELDDDGVAAHCYHPMVAKLLREQSRRAARRPTAPDLWISLDGVRVPRPDSGHAAPRRRRRMMGTAQSLLVSGIAPVMGCRCGFTDEHMDMVQCDGCARWLHLACVGVVHVDQLGADEWVCDDCYERAGLAQRADALLDPALSQHAHARSSTLSLAPSPKRLPYAMGDLTHGTPRAARTPAAAHAGDAPAWALSPAPDAGGGGGSTVPKAQPWRTPSPPPTPMDMRMVTPSRHVHYDTGTVQPMPPVPAVGAAHTPGLATPSRYLMQTPQHGMLALVTPRRAGGTAGLLAWDTPQADFFHPSGGTFASGGAFASGGTSGGARGRRGWPIPDSPTPATRRARRSASLHPSPVLGESPTALFHTPTKTSHTASMATTPPSSGRGHATSSTFDSSSPFPATPTAPADATRAARKSADPMRASLAMNLQMASPRKRASPGEPGPLLSALPALMRDDAA
ncbi:hypothetical protein MSPP1_002223 [Malassezia sp. CBS 17886]|nr:hypothetical protein MSPP1_002223 [Malassezia sp. CBS 17886]